MRDDFAVFILSHGRAENQITLQSLQLAGYSGRLYIIVDDLDEQADRYKELYGERVKVFDKKEYARNVDTMTSREELKTVLYARNAAYDIACEMGIRFFAEFDDDLSGFMFRYEDCGKLRSCKIKDIDSVFEALIEFQENSGAYSVGIDSANGMIGGLHGKWEKKIVRNIYQSFILRTDKRIKFAGILNEDDIAGLLYNSTGRLTFTFTEINQHSPMRSTNRGGLQALYNENDAYVRAFYSVIACPVIKIWAKSNGKVTLKKIEKNLYPLILSEKWKKYA